MPVLSVPHCLKLENMFWQTQIFHGYSGFIPLRKHRYSMAHAELAEACCVPSKAKPSLQSLACSDTPGTCLEVGGQLLHAQVRNSTCTSQQFLTPEYHTDTTLI